MDFCTFSKEHLPKLKKYHYHRTKEVGEESYLGLAWLALRNSANDEPISNSLMKVKGQIRDSVKYDRLKTNSMDWLVKTINPQKDLDFQIDLENFIKSLTGHEQIVLKGVLLGHKLKEIASALSVSNSTVSDLFNSVKDKLIYADIFTLPRFR